MLNKKSIRIAISLVVVASVTACLVYYLNREIKTKELENDFVDNNKSSISNFIGPAISPEKEIAKLDINFTKEGNIVKNNPGMEQGVWYLIYEAVGASAKKEKLIFIPESKCTFNAVTKSCYETQISQGDRIYVSGEKIDIGVKVSTIIIKEKSVQ